MTQIFKVEIDSISWTDRVVKCDYSSLMDRAYDVVTLEISGKNPPAPKTDVVVTMQDTVFYGFVYDSIRIGRHLWRVVCRSDSAKLTLPFSQIEEKIEPISSASQLMAYYSNISTVNIDYRSVDLNFGAGFQRTGTMLDAVAQIARVTGSQIRTTDGGRGVIIEPLEDIADEGIFIGPDEYFNFSRRTETIETSGVGHVIVSDGESIDSNPQKCTIEINDNTRQVKIFPVPSETLKPVEGITNFEYIDSFEVETFTLNNQSLIELKASIGDIVSITLNGRKIYYRDFNYNVVYFEESLTGIVTVTYMAKAYTGFLKIETTPIGAYYLVRLDHNGEICIKQGILKSDISDNSFLCDWVASKNQDVASVCGPARKNYVKGFSLYVIPKDADISFTYRKDGELIPGLFSPTASDVNYKLREELDLEPYPGTGGQWVARARLSHVPGTIIEVYTSELGETDSSHYHYEDQYLYFDYLYHDVRIAYDQEAREYHFQKEDMHARIELLVGLNPVSDYITYELEGFDKYDLDSYPCSLPQSLPVDIVGQLGVPPIKAVGKVVSVNEGQRFVGSYNVDNMGFIFVDADRDGNYKCDTNSIIPGSYCILKVTTGG